MYDLSKIDVKTIILSGDLDTSATPADVAWLLDESQSGFKSSNVVFSSHYYLNHYGFVYSSVMTYFDVVPMLIKKYG